jgi:hypothetical protein
LDEGKVQSDPVVCEKVSSVTDDFDPARLLVESVYSGEDFMVRNDVFALNRRFPIGVPPF